MMYKTHWFFLNEKINRDTKIIKIFNASNNIIIFKEIAKIVRRNEENHLINQMKTLITYQEMTEEDRRHHDKEIRELKETRRKIIENISIEDS